MTLQNALEKLARGNEFILSETGYAIKRQIKSGPLAGSFYPEPITNRLRLALQRRGYVATNRFINR